MLIFALVRRVFSFLHRVLFLPMLIRFLLIFFLSGFRLFTNQTFTSPLFSDDVSLFIVFIRAFVLFISLLSTKSYSKLRAFVLLVLLVSCIFVFISNNSLRIFIFYEASLFPILFIILKWGSYPERRLRALMLLIYTIVFTLPFLYVLFYVYCHSYTLSLSSLYFKSVTNSQLIVFITFLAFSVKLPVYGLHFWLPIAHVEAPTFGSIILAGILLKLGGAGLIRFLPLFDLSSLRFSLISYAIVFIVYSTLVCCTQSDFKRLIAYSSVSHIIALVPLVLSDTLSRAYAMVLLMLFHGISSPLLFFLVGLSYELNSTRQLSLLRGFIVTSPFLSLCFCFGFFFTLRAPPFPSFIREVFFIIGAMSVSFLFLVPILLFTFFSLVYNLNWLSTVLFNPSNPTSNLQLLSGKTVLLVSLVSLFTVLLLVFLLLCDFS